MLDSIIIGSGPAGLTAGIYGKRAGISFALVEKNFMGTGQIAESGQVDNYPGMVGTSGFDLGQKFLEDAEGMGVEIKEGEVTAIEQTEGGFRILLSDGACMESRTVIYCGGATHRRLGLKEEETYAGTGVSYCAICDGTFYKGMEVAVVGGGDTALDEACYLSNICKKVYLIHRRDAFRGSAAALERLKEKENVELVLNSRITSMEGNGKLERICLNGETIIPVDGVFVAIGMEPQVGLIREMIDLDEAGYVLADETGKTKTNGLFVAGDIRSKQLRQVVTAVADGANAMISAIDYLKES